MTERALLGPNGAPLAPRSEPLSREEGIDSGQADKPEECFTYRGRRIDREDLVDTRARTIMPGPAGILLIERIQLDRYILSDLAGEILGLTQSREECERLAGEYHISAEMRQTEAAPRESRARQERRAEIRQNRWNYNPKEFSRLLCKRSNLLRNADCALCWSVARTRPRSLSGSPVNMLLPR